MKSNSLHTINYLLKCNEQSHTISKQPENTERSRDISLKTLSIKLQFFI